MESLTCFGVVVFLGKKDDDGITDLIDIPKRTSPAKGIIHMSSYACKHFLSFLRSDYE